MKLLSVDYMSMHLKRLFIIHYYRNGAYGDLQLFGASDDVVYAIFHASLVTSKKANIPIVVALSYTYLLMFEQIRIM